MQKWVSTLDSPPDRHFQLQEQYLTLGTIELTCNYRVPKSDYDIIEWVPHTELKPYYLDINKELTLIQSRLFEARWERLRNLINEEPRNEAPVIMPEALYDFYELGP